MIPVIATITMADCHIQQGCNRPVTPIDVCPPGRGWLREVRRDISVKQVFNHALQDVVLVLRADSGRFGEFIAPSPEREMTYLNFMLSVSQELRQQCMWRVLNVKLSQGHSVGIMALADRDETGLEIVRRLAQKNPKFRFVALL